MMHKQQGMTFIGWVLVLAIIGLFALAAIRLTPIYMEYMKISSALDGTQKEFAGKKDISAKDVSSAISKRFSVEGVRIIKTADVKIASAENGLMVTAQYEHIAPFVANVSFKVDFDKSVEITR